MDAGADAEAPPVPLTSGDDCLTGDALLLFLAAAGFRTFGERGASAIVEEGGGVWVWIGLIRGLSVGGVAVTVTPGPVGAVSADMSVANMMGARVRTATSEWCRRRHWWGVDHVYIRRRAYACCALACAASDHDKLNKGVDG